MGGVSVTGEFKFLDPGRLVDGELELKLIRCHSADPFKGWVPWYEFALYESGVKSPAGQLSFRSGTGPWLEKYGGHIGYGVDAAHRGRHFAERAVRLILPFVRRHGFHQIWITCNPDNWPSRRTCERLGAVFTEIVDLPPEHEMYLRGERQKCRYRLDL
jgi:tagatose 1,6-diphosphate aldolase